MSRTLSRRELPARWVAALLGTSSIALLSLYSMPLLVGALIDHAGLDDRRAGLVASAELAAMAASAAFATLLVGRLSRTRLAAVGAAMVVGGQLGSALLASYGPLLCIRALAGLGAGIALAACSATLPLSQQPDRLFARVMLLRSLLLGAMLPLLPFAIVHAGSSGAYAALGAAAFAMMPAVGWIPARACSASGDSRTPSRRAEEKIEPAPFTLLTPNGLRVLTAILLVATGDAALWTFSERIGTAVGLSTNAVGFALAVATCTGLVGAGAADYLATSRGRRRPIAVAMSAVAAAGLVLASVANAWIFAATLVAYTVGFFFLIPYLMGTAAALDPSGRCAVAASSTFLAGAAIGPALAGAVLSYGAGFAALAWMLIAAVGAASVLVWPVVRRLDGADSGGGGTTALPAAEPA